jgi:hypothetical protein
MGSWWSSPAPMAAIRVAVIGHTQTGKSHFVSRVSGLGDDTIETRRPTFGLTSGSIAYGGHRLEFTEIGYLALSTTRTLSGFDCVMWFIDSHDPVEDILSMRSHVVRLACDEQPAAAAKRDKDKRVRLDEVVQQLPPVPLCIVQNNGRPFCWRHAIENGAWVDGAHHPFQPRYVEWHQLRSVCQADQLPPTYVGVMMAQLSYTDPDAPALLFRWIISRHEGL